MGYESKIYIVEKTNYSWAEENGMKYQWGDIAVLHYGY